MVLYLFCGLLLYFVVKVLVFCFICFNTFGHICLSTCFSLYLFYLILYLFVSFHCSRRVVHLLLNRSLHLLRESGCEFPPVWLGSEGEWRSEGEPENPPGGCEGEEGTRGAGGPSRVL